MGPNRTPASGRGTPKFAVNGIQPWVPPGRRSYIGARLTVLLPYSSPNDTPAGLVLTSARSAQWSPMQQSPANSPAKPRQATRKGTPIVPAAPRSPVSGAPWRRHRTTSPASRVVKPMAPGAALHRSTRRAPRAIAIAVRRERGMPFNVTRKLIGSHLVSGEMTPGEEIAIQIDQTLTQDATGTLVMQELEALGLDRVRTEVSVQYVDHNLLQTDEKNAEDHEYLRTAAQRFGIWYSKPGNGVSHPTHMQRFGIPGKTMVASDSHTPAAGSLGMLAIGVGGLEVALAMSGRPLHIRMPQVWGVRLDGELPEWCSAKDVILEMLRRHDVKGGVNRII